MLEFLIQKYRKVVDVVNKSSTVNKITMTPLCVACEYGQENIVKLLISNRAMVNKEMVNKENAEKKTPLYIAYEKNNESISELLANAKTYANEREAFVLACKNGAVGMVKLLISRYGADDIVNWTNLEGITPLYSACKEGHEEIVKMLIKQGANVDQKNTEDGKTPLYVACKGGKEGHEAIVKELIAAGASINLETDYDGTPFAAAKNEKHEAIVQLLHKNSAKGVLPRKKPQPSQQLNLFPPAPSTEKSEETKKVKSTCTWGKGALSTDMEDVKEIENGTNQYFYCPPHIKEELEVSGMLKQFEQSLKVPHFCGPVDASGLKSLEGDFPKLSFTMGTHNFEAIPSFELKHKQKTNAEYRIFGVEVPSDSQEPGKQGALYVLFKVGDALHSNANEKALSTSLRNSNSLNITLPKNPTLKK